ncbi:uncharacterized protein AC631_02222 [Debaryomyces fabryi]|uniref:Uncharacterized protein n=1 Tax=Debaryomyces fabryi TaxID=58627 RepID=A0A0V1Q0M3_9ASCO|nr:uncharacterized protein AC631_02222 [Debaryomyces fabryi]KSA02009.1 hypothetical protein AC631_02222 [Debaryomyces fabryi]CUM51318.1 unnamed protein product [Debaryomyces fabryi]
MSEYPEYVNGEPPVITLQEYDVASWNKTTCVDSRPDGYVVVIMEKPEVVVARIDKSGDETLDKIFRSAKQSYAEQNAK